MAQEETAATPGKRLGRTERRAQIVAAATTAFARNGFAATSLDDIAAQAGISRAILYRHFDSKTDLYRSVLDRTMEHLGATVGTGPYTPESIPALVRAAAADPDGFRLLFRHTAREPEFRSIVDALTATATEITDSHLAEFISDPGWAAWAARLTPTVAIEAVLAWLDAGQPDPEHAPAHIGAAIQGVIQAAR